MNPISRPLLRALKAPRLFAPCSMDLLASSIGKVGKKWGNVPNHTSQVMYHYFTFMVPSLPTYQTGTNVAPPRHCTYHLPTYLYLPTKPILINVTYFSRLL